MASLFPKWTNRIPIFLGVGIPVVLLGVVAFIWYYFSPKFLSMGYTPEQPVAFSHQLHAGKLGIDCFYCHSTAQKSGFAALPATDTCLGCHNKVLRDSPRLKLVREAHANKTPIPWVQVNFLPRYVHFDHSAHISVGVGCVSCHGRVDKMEQVSLANPLSMSWCLECHRNPAPYLRPQSEITNMIYKPDGDQLGGNLSEHAAQIQPPTACGACHY